MKKSYNLGARFESLLGAHVSQYVSEVAAKFFGQLLTHILFTAMLCCTACRTDITHLEPFTGYVRPDDKQFSKDIS